jgi:hypothetical protein
MNRSLLLLCLGCWAAGAGAGAHARQAVRTWSDPPADAVLRRTDLGATAPLLPGATLPDMVSVTLSGWSPTTPVTDPFVGVVAPAAGAPILRLDIVFSGLVNPSGPIQFPHDPARFGPSPVYGFVDFDVDQDINTGGEVTNGRYNYLEQLARFGAVPTGPLAERAATERRQIDFNFGSAPYYERSGADFTFTLCGCTDVSIVSQGSVGDPNGVFEAGETWVVRGRFFQRSAGYRCSSFSSGGSEPFLYEPLVNIRFKHSTTSNRTTVSLVFPLTMLGASILTGQPEQEAEFTYDFGPHHHFSVYEALNDVVVAAPFATDECTVLAAAWAGRNAANYLNVLNWNANAIFGSSYLMHPPNASFVWTDAGFGHVTGDLTGDGRADAVDRAAIQSFITEADGGADDCDGVHNGSVRLCDFAFNYNVRDINYDGLVNSADIALIPQLCPADWDQRNGLNTNDFFAFLADFFAGHADFNADGQTNSADFLAFISAFFTGCP